MPTKHQKLLFVLNSDNPKTMDFDKAIEFAETRKEVFHKFVTFCDTSDVMRYSQSGTSVQNPLQGISKAEVLTLKARFAALCANNEVIGSLVNERTSQMLPLATIPINSGSEIHTIQDMHRVVSYGRFFSTLNMLSFYSGLHPKIKNWICQDFSTHRFSLSNRALMHLFINQFRKELLEEGYPHIPTFEEKPNELSLDETRAFRDWVESNWYANNENTRTSNNGFTRIREDGSYYVPSGSDLLFILCSNIIAEIHGKLRNLSRNRNRLNSRNNQFQNMGQKFHNTLMELSNNRPSCWDSPVSVSSFSRLWAKKKYPAGSMVGIEIEFVGTTDTVQNTNFEPCGDCDVCNDPDSEETCSYGHYQGIIFPELPFVWWKRDGSISSQSDNETVLEFQEVNLVCNINDSTDSKRISDVLDWMNSRDMKVNRTCGLHVHVDCREMTGNMFGRKANKMEVAMKNWIQFMVPFKRSTNSYCRVFDNNTSSRYNAVNRQSFQEHQTLEIRIGSASLNASKVKNWAKLMHYLVHTREDVSTITEFLKSDASPELKAFAIARIVKFYLSHKNGRTPGHRESNPEYSADSIGSGPNPKKNIPAEITEMYLSYNNVNQREDTEA